MSSLYEQDYLGLLNSVLENGTHRKSRAGNTVHLFGTSLKIYDLKHGAFPLLTSRKIFYKPVLGELAAFLRGAEELSTFKMFGCNYWDANAKDWVANLGLAPEHMRVGRIYGAQWRNWGNGVDQLSTLVDNLKENPFSRRHLLTTYNPEELGDACLPPCHLLAQFNVTTDGFLDCMVYMRSVDLCLGLPSDVILYAALMVLLAKEVDLRPGVLTFSMGDTHIYENHIINFLAQRGQPLYELPRYKLSPDYNLWNFIPEALTISDYSHGERIAYQFNV